LALFVNRRVTLAARPSGFPEESDFAIDEAEMAEPGPGEVLIRTLWVSVDPYQRGRMSTTRSYARSLELGDVITAQAVGEVVESRDGRFSEGDLAVGQLGWQEYAVARAGSVRPVPAALDPPTLALHAVGTTGFTAYFGLLDVGQPRPGETVVVSGAAGGVGHVVGQIARLTGCRTVGIAGGAEKCRDLVDSYGYDAAIDYKADDVRAAVKEACPAGVDVYFDNVGGEISAAVHPRLTIGARIVICGQISQYNLERPEPTFHPGLLIVFRARM
jgi:NADPH-dependent curcumin reductase CurA